MLHFSQLVPFHAPHFPRNQLHWAGFPHAFVDVERDVRVRVHAFP